MRRSVLVTLAAVGGLICLIGGTGLFAALTDSAQSGTNSVESAPLAASADIQLARAEFDDPTGALNCGAFSENLTTGLFTRANTQPGFLIENTYYCIRNVGSQPVDLSALVDELADVDYACTGDEELHGDTTCGGDAAGELSRRVAVEYFEHPNCQAAPVRLGGHYLADNVATPQALGSIVPGVDRCFGLRLSEVGTGAQNQLAQSDRVTWRFKWVGQA